MMYHEFVSLLRTITLKDCGELFIFVSLFLCVFKFLSRDRDLLFKSIGFIGLFMASFFFDFSGLYHFLFAFLPVIGVLFVIFHKEVLQKNYVFIKRIHSPKIHKKIDAEQLIRLLLNTMNAGHDIALIIEQVDILPLTSDKLINAALNETTLTMLVASPIYDSSLLVLVRNAQLSSFNCAYEMKKELCFIDSTVKSLPTWKEHGLLLTQKSDAFVVAVNASTRYFSFIAQGTIQDHLNAQGALRLIAHCCNKVSNNKKEFYDHKRQDVRQKEGNY